jgi:hypothetical protein
MTSQKLVALKNLSPVSSSINKLDAIPNSNSNNNNNNSDNGGSSSKVSKNFINFFFGSFY